MPSVIKNNDCSIVFNGKDYPCPVSMAMDIIGGKWKGVILYYLKDKNKRFSELKKDIPNITEMTLSIQLKKLEADKLILREVFGDKAPMKVVYSLTDFGRTLNPILDAIFVWSHSVPSEISSMS